MTADADVLLDERTVIFDEAFPVTVKAALAVKEPKDGTTETIRLSAKMSETLFLKNFFIYSPSRYVIILQFFQYIKVQSYSNKKREKSQMLGEK